MFTSEDQQTFINRGITEAQVLEQLDYFKKGFPYLTLEGPASVSNGVVKADESLLTASTTDWEDYLKGERPYCAVTFDTNLACVDKNIQFIMPLHPLVQQAAFYCREQV